MHKLIPYSIVAVFVLFAAFIFTLVGGAMNSENEKVAENYYTQSVNYDKKMADMRRAGKGLQIDSSAEHRLWAVLPDKFAHARGSIVFFRPSDMSLDFKTEFTADAAGKFTIEDERLTPGHWTAQAEWMHEGKKCYSEPKFELK